jgi:membrane protease YdiL (CAAX protease family)
MLLGRGGQHTLHARTGESFLHLYFQEGKSVSLNLFFTIPLLLLYELGILLSGSDMRNAAEVILKDLRLLMGSWGIRALHWFIIILVVFFFYRAYHKKGPFVGYFLLMVMESVLLAFLLGPFLSLFLGSVLLDFPLTRDETPVFSVRVFLSLGAGVYEEFLFRFLLMGGLFLVFIRFFRVPRLYGGALALVISGFLFAAYHHLGPYGQSWSPYLFLFRFGAGIVLGMVFMARGFAVAVYLHVFYDILRDVEGAMDGLA